MTIAMRKSAHKNMVTAAGGVDTCIGAALTSMCVFAIGQSFLGQTLTKLPMSGLLSLGIFLLLTAVLAFALKGISSMVSEYAVRKIRGDYRKVQPICVLSVVSILISSVFVLAEVMDYTIDAGSVPALAALAASIIFLILVNNIRKRCERY